MKKAMLYFIIIFFVTTLVGCTSITRRIEVAANTPSSYSAATTHDKVILQKSPNINLDRYKSVETRASQRPDIAIAVATSGGGYRAANFAAGIFMGMENIRSPYLHGNLLQEVDYFSSVSGGGFAVGYYLTHLYNYQYQYQNVANPPPFSFYETMRPILQENSKGLLNSRNALGRDYTDLLFFGDDRGVRLEQDINNHLLKTPQGGLTLGNIFIPTSSSQPVRLPYWTTNTTIYQDSQMFPISPDTLAHFKVRGYWHNHRYNWMTANFNDPNFATNFPVAVGLTASASLPFVFPSTTLTSQACTTRDCYLQLLDGGLSDNTGIFSAVNFLYQDPAKIKVLIIIDASNTTTQPFSSSKQGPGGFSLLWQIFNMTTDALHDHIRTYIKFTAKDILCAHHAKNVVIIYLNLAEDIGARSIGTNLQITPDQQRYLVNLGQSMLQQNAELRTFLTGLTLNGLNTNTCPVVNMSTGLSIPN